MAKELLLSRSMGPAGKSGLVQPLKIKRSKPASGIKRLLVGLLFLLPMLWLAVLWVSGTDIHASNPGLNLLVHAWLVLVPLAWAVTLTCKPLQFEESEEIRLGCNHYLSAWRADWWMSLMLWAPAVFALAALTVDCWTVFVRHPDQLVTSPPGAAVLVLMVTVMGSFYGVVLFERLEPRVSVYGIRAGLTHFHEWERIDHVSRKGGIYSLYHRTRPELPAVSFRLAGTDATAILEQFLSRFQIPVSHGDSRMLRLVQAGVLLGFCVVLGFGFVLHYQLHFSLAWSVFITFLIGLGLGSLLERIRGVPHYTKQRPKLR